MTAPALSDIDIDNFFWSKKANVPIKSWGGCYLSDELPARPEQGKQYIVNIAKSTQINLDNTVGTHWCAISNLLDSTIHYFDPFGEPPNTLTLKFLKKARCFRRNQTVQKKILYSTNQVQGLDGKNSEACGWFCIYFLKQLLAHKNFEDIIYNFDLFHPWMNTQFLKQIKSNETVGIIH
jgi:hypothetical protein